jgi:hypothetical protein
MDNETLPDGTVSETWVDQLQVPAGMLTVVVEDVTELKAACTSAAEQLAALMVCASAAKALNRSMNDSHFIAMVGGTIPY